ncbi:hypothetical protein [Streptomyces sp. NPDC047000]|uniref:hypothetical protein n=1 Tax=Streptomyces sp. NPDC047000 TaxID=3155474 RepID=UPI0033F6D4B6
MTVDQLLARARLHHNPAVPDDTVAYEDCAYPVPAPDGALPGAGADPAVDATAAGDLNALCEAVVNSAVPATVEFLTEQLPEPPSAWLLGCALNLAAVEDGARFWWQFAAGAGHVPAAYCLALHHLARGEVHAAAFWYDQVGLDDPVESDSFTVSGVRPPLQQFRFDASVPTVLRILSYLAPPEHRPRTHRADAITNYVAYAVTDGYTHHPNVEIPLPGPRFADRVTFILTSTPPWTRRASRTFKPALPSRPPVVGAHCPRSQDASAKG